jgi:TfoX/Sxy family transcriptional regulator of competence genes
MAYDERLAERVRDMVQRRPGVTERKMFGGLGWMIGGNMACGLMSDGLLVRIPTGETADALRRPHVREFGFPDRKPMRGFVLVEPDGLADDAELASWVDAGADYAASLPPK